MTRHNEERAIWGCWSSGQEYYDSPSNFYSSQHFKFFSLIQIHTLTVQTTKDKQEIYRFKSLATQLLLCCIPTKQLAFFQIWNLSSVSTTNS